MTVTSTRWRVMPGRIGDGRPTMPNKLRRRLEVRGAVLELPPTTIEQAAAVVTALHAAHPGGEAVLAWEGGRCAWIPTDRPFTKEMPTPLRIVDVAAILDHDVPMPTPPSDPGAAALFARITGQTAPAEADLRRLKAYDGPRLRVWAVRWPRLHPKAGRLAGPWRYQVRGPLGEDLAGAECVTPAEALAKGLADLDVQLSTFARR